ncbi:MAG: ATP-binding cassette domain-containing protein [Kofleriaceae bacterium]|nr:ATP-binding cassette domain-containing protein [Kofleriaceae bacterium]
MSAPSATANVVPLALRVRASKAFAGRPVLIDVELQLRPGTVHALVGENGAGKSTLAKIAAGLLPFDSGRIERDGQQFFDGTRLTVHAARAAGIGMVQQHGSFAPGLTVAENASVGYEATTHGRLQLAVTADRLRTLGQRTGLIVQPHALVDSLSVGQTQRAELLTVLARDAKVLILDEPTALLTPREVEELLQVLRQLADDGTAIILVTHRLREVRAVADDVTVLRNGRNVATFTLPALAQREATDDNVAATTAMLDRIAAAMVGHSNLAVVGRTAPPAANAAPVLHMRTVDAPGLALAALDVRAGEIVGVAGIEGNGQRVLCDVITGHMPATGTITLAGTTLTGLSIAARRRHGVAFIPDDRQVAGLWLAASVATNLVLDRTDITGRFRLRRKAIAEFAAGQIAHFDIRPANPDTPVQELSGGNQQKVVAAREMARPKVQLLVAAQPTRGVDFAASAIIWTQLQRSANAGAAVLVVSADLDELFTIAHRIVVLRQGAIVGEVNCVGTSAGEREQRRADIGAWMVQA